MWSLALFMFCAWGTSELLQTTMSKICTICLHPTTVHKWAFVLGHLRPKTDDWLSSNRPTVNHRLLYVLDTQVSAVNWSSTRKQLDRPGKTKRAFRVNWIWLNARISGSVKQVVVEKSHPVGTCAESFITFHGRKACHVCQAYAIYSLSSAKIEIKTLVITGMFLPLLWGGVLVSFTGKMEATPVSVFTFLVSGTFMLFHCTSILLMVYSPAAPLHLLWCYYLLN